MIARFFVILQRNWTYEVEYTFEICRLVLIHVITLVIPALIRCIPNLSVWVYLTFSFAVGFIFWWFYFRYSVGRLIQIKRNRKYAVHLTYEQLVQIMDAYPNQDLYCKVNSKYKRLTVIDDVRPDDEVVLILIGKKSLEDLKKWRKIVQSDDKNIS